MAAISRASRMPVDERGDVLGLGERVGEDPRLVAGSAERSAPARGSCGAISTGPSVIAWPSNSSAPWSTKYAGAKWYWTSGAGQAGPGADERERLGDGRGQRPAAPQQPLRRGTAGCSASTSEPRSTSQTTVMNGWSWRFSPTPARRPRPSMPSARSCVGRPDAGQHQQLRGAERAGGEDDLARGVGRRARRPQPVAVGDAGGALAAPAAIRSTVAPVTTWRFAAVADRAQVGVVGAPALAVALGHLGDSAAPSCSGPL